MSADFSDITIAGISPGGILQIEGEDDLFEIPFRLSSPPPEKWLQIFQQSWEEWQSGAGDNFAINDIRVVGVLLGVTVNYDVLASGGPAQRFNFSKLFEGLQATIGEVNSAYKNWRRRQDEKVFALKTMIDRLGA